MDWKALLFSFRGRINRAKYWLVFLHQRGHLGGLHWRSRSLDERSEDGIYGDATGGSIAAIGLIMIILISIFWSSLAIGCKRLHDRNKSGVWLLLFWLAPSVLNAIGQSIGANGAGVFVALVGAAHRALGVC